MRILDLFCGAGGAGMGYARAGFEVVGVDNNPNVKKYNPHPVVIDDALDYVRRHGHEFDAIHASPPCQAYSVATPKRTRHNHPMLIDDIKQLLDSTAKPYVIENVAGAKAHLKNSIMLCGSMFGLRVYRHRYFLSNVMLFQPHHYPHRDNTPRAWHGVSEKGFISITSGGMKITGDLLTEIEKLAERNERYSRKQLYPGGFVSVTGRNLGGAAAYARFAMGIDWDITNGMLSQAIPPAYTEYIGKQLLRHLQNTP